MGGALLWLTDLLPTPPGWPTSLEAIASLPGLSPTPASSFHLPDVVVVVVVGLTLPCLFPPPSQGQARPAPLAAEGGR